MKFAIQTASFNNPIPDYPILLEKYGAVSSDCDNPWCEHAIVELSSLNELVQLSKDTQHNIIVKTKDAYFDNPILIIYDNYIE